MKIAFLGDIHGNPYSLLNAIKKAIAGGAECLIQVGDFGLMSWRKQDQDAFRTVLAEHDFPVYFIDGNHDDCTYWTRPEYPHLFDIPNLVYIPRGSVLEFGGLNIAFMGGAGSIDKAYRLRQRLHWDPAEQIRVEDIYNMRRNIVGNKIDIFVTHTPPNCVIESNFDPLGKLMFGVSINWEDPSAYIVEDLWNEMGKPLNISGHMHRSVSGPNFQILNINELLFIDSEDFRKE